MSEARKQLESEAAVFHRVLFGTNPERKLVDAYVRVHDFYPTSAADSARLAEMLRAELDFEARELLLRRQDPVLTRKFRILVYLAEATPAGYRQLVDPGTGRVRAWLSLAGAVMRTVASRARGIARREAPLVRIPGKSNRDLEKP